VSNVYAVVDFNTGAVDGFYRDFMTAQQMHKHFIECGATNVVVVEVVKGIKGNRISDQVFWNRHPVGFTGYMRPS
jgi:hypothetical protein